MSNYSKLALFVGGTLFGSVGLKVLGSREAKQLYVQAAAAGLRAKDSAMETVTMLQENAADILAEARELNEIRAAKAADREKQSEIVDESEEKEDNIEE